MTAMAAAGPGVLLASSAAREASIHNRERAQMQKWYHTYDHPMHQGQDRIIHRELGYGMSRAWAYCRFA